MNRPCGPDRPSLRRASWLLTAGALLVLAAVYVSQGLTIVGVPQEAFFSKVFVDDAAYYVVPARHLWEGKGYSFDGKYATNGVQPLWAAVAVAVAGATPDDAVVARVLSGLSGLCWGLAACFLYACFARKSRLVGLLVAVGMVTVGLGERYAFQGMENGLQAMLVAAMLCLALRIADPDQPPPDGLRWTFFAGLGVLSALIGLARIDTVLWAVLLCLAIWVGLFQRRGGRRLCWGPAFSFGVPVLVLFGGYLLFNRVAFGAWMPISGRVKAFYESQWLAGGYPHGGFWGNAFHHFKLAADSALLPIGEGVRQLLYRRGDAIEGGGLYAWGVIVCLVLGVLLIAGGWLRRRSAGQPGSLSQRLAMLVAAWVVLHVLLLATFLPHFVSYCTWYLAFACVGIWFLIGCVVISVRARGGWKGVLVNGLLVALVVFLLGSTVTRDYAGALRGDLRCSVFARAGQWLDRHVPGGQFVGSLSAGLISMHTRCHDVYNLDGIVAGHDYLEHYLRAERVAAFLDEQGINLFADYHPLSIWQSGISWQGQIVTPSHDRLLCWWWLDPATAYCIYDLTPEAHPPWPTQPFVQVQFDAAVHGKYRLIDEGELSAALQEEPDLTVLTSVVVWEDLSLKHVMVERADRPLPGLPARPLALANPLGADFGGQVRLLSYDYWPRRVARGETLILRRQWEVLGNDPPDATVETYICVAPPEYFWQVGPACHGTYPVGQWRRGEVIDETYVLRVSPETAPGCYPLTVGLWVEPSGWVPPNDDRGSPRKGMVFVGNLVVE